MKKGFFSIASLPPEYKRRLIQSAGVYVALLVCAGLWIGLSSKKAVETFEGKIPNAETQVKSVYLTPQLEKIDTPAPVFSDSALPPEGVEKGASVSIIMTDLSFSKTATERAIKDLPQPIALAFFPQDFSKGLMESAAGKSRETVLLLPMEPRSYPKDDPGPKSFLTKSSDSQNAKLAESLLKQAAGVTAVMNFMGSSFLSDKDRSAPIFGALGEKKLPFIEDNSSVKSVAGAQSEINSLPYMKADIIIDKTATETDVAQALIALEKKAKHNGYAIGIAHPYPVTFNMLKSWNADLEKRGVRLIPLSEMLKAKGKEYLAAKGSDKMPPPPASEEEQAVPVTEMPAATMPTETQHE